MKKIKIFKFATDHEHLEGIFPAKKYIPKWYKDAEAYGYGNVEIENNFPNKNFKNCVPFFDSLSSGYIMELWCDINVSLNDDGNHYFTWGDGDPEPLVSRAGDIDRIPTPIGYHKQEYVWKIPYCIKTPKGYSIIMCHPFNRYELPFLTLGGIIDAESTIGKGNLPFYIKKDFQGVIKKGTPIAQLIPFKRENWKIEKDASIFIEGSNNTKKSKNSFFDYYKKNLWHKKSYD